jgi:hypothetical protein
LGDSRHLQSDRRFVVHGLLYVFSALVFIGLAVASSVILGSRVVESRILSFGVVQVALIFFVAGVSLVVSFVLRRWRSTQNLSGRGHTRWSRVLRDDELEGWT